MSRFAAVRYTAARIPLSADGSPDDGPAQSALSLVPAWFCYRLCSNNVCPVIMKHCIEITMRTACFLKPSARVETCTEVGAEDRGLRFLLCF